MALPSNFEEWNVDQTCQYLQEEGLGVWENTFRVQEITGDRLRGLTVDALKDMGIDNPDDHKRILHCIRKLWQIQAKVFNDPIHGHVELHPLLIKIIDTPQFQRLRNIKQLGGAYFVYPGASHNRFEHSIGVAHLAGELARALRTRQPDLDINDRDILCVQIAGLCHDLGHGPFSHLYDRMFIPRARPGTQWEHEDASLTMLDYMVEKNNLEPVMREHKLVLPQDLVFIKEMIKPNANAAQGQEWQYVGRLKEKSFLYEIVANKTTGVDVDKFDYFARDSYHLGIQSNFDHHRFLKFAMVYKVDGQNHICIRDKEEDNMDEMFHTRLCLHRRAYQHKTNKIIETMITEAFLKADGHISFEGSNGKQFTLSTAINDMEAYTKLTDHVFWQILASTGPAPAPAPAPGPGPSPGPGPAPGLATGSDLLPAKKILNRIISRDIYRFLGETRSKILIKVPDSRVDGGGGEAGGGRGGEAGADEGEAGGVKGGEAEREAGNTQEMKQQWKQELAQKLSMKSEDFEIMVVTMDYGMKNEDPIDKMYFYSKFDTTKAFKRKHVQVSRIRTKTFSEHLIRFYCRKTDEEILKAVSDLFKEWCKDKGFPEYQD